MKCDDCKYLRRDVKVFGGAELPARYGKYTNPCDRYPQSIMRSPKEPACGEFKPKESEEQNDRTKADNGAGGSQELPGQPGR
jgi:hypothetical protein